MSDDAPRNDTNRRKIRLETRFGSARQSRSRKDRPCDLCRGRKSACVIAVKPPCRLCESRGLECTFTSEPSRKRTAAQQSSSIPRDETSSDASLGRSVQKSVVTSPTTTSKRGQSPRETWETQLPYEQSPVLSNAITPESANLQLPQIIPSQTTSSPISFSSPQRIFYRSPQSKDDPILSGGHEYSLEDAKDLTAHFIGLSGEQDTDLLASIRYNVLNETSFVDFNIHKVYPGNSTQNKPPIHFSIVHDSFPERDQRAKRSASDAIEHHVRGHSDALLRLYFRFVHPIFPILSKARILRTYASDKLRIPASLRGVIYGLACAFWDQDQTLSGSLRVTQPELFEYAHVALNRELDSPKLSTLQACLLLLHEQPDAHGTTESPKVWTYACQATACAQSLGLHQDPSSWRIESWEKSLRRKLWWATYWTDRWTSICHGHPPHITDDSFDTKELELEDLSIDEDVVGLPGWSLVAENERTFNVSGALRFLESLSLSRLLSDVLKSSFTLQSYAQSYDRITGNIKEDIEHNRTLNERITNLPGILSMDTSYPHPNINGPLHLSIFALKFLSLRALMAPVRSTSKSNPLSNLCRHFESALIEGQTFVKFVSALRPTDIHVFWPRHSRTHLIIAANFLIYLFFGASTERQVTEAYEMLQQLQDDLRFMADMADWSTIGLVRPALLRVDSFFHGAAKGIRDAGTG